MNTQGIVGFVGWIVAASVCCSSSAQLVYPPPWNASLVGHIGGWCRTVEIVDRYAYVGERADLTILNVTNPSSPVPAGHLSFGDFYFSDIQVEDRLAYIAGGSYVGHSGLQIVDVTNPLSPRPHGFYPTPVGPYGVYVTDGLAYVAIRYGPNPWDGGSVQVIDVSDPSSPTLRGTFITASGSWKVNVQDGFAYVATDYGLDILDVTTPSLPRRLALHSQRHCRDVFVAGGLAYTATDDGLEIVDVTSPTAPMRRWLIGRCDAFAVSVSGSFVFFTQPGCQTMEIVDLTNPSSPTLPGSLRTSGWPWDVAVSSDTAYIADGPGGLAIVDVANPSTPTLRATYDTLSDAQDVCVADGVAYVANGVRGLKTVDVSDPRWPTVLASVATSSTASRVDASGGFVYVSGTLTDPDDGDRGVLQIFDVTNPSSPTSVGSYDKPGGFGAVTVSDGVAYVIHSDAMLIIDVTNPSSPMLRGSFVTPGLASDVFVSGDVVFIADYTSLQIVDVQNSTSPVLRSSFPGFRITEVFVSNGIAYITGTWAQADFACVDVTNPDAPKLLGTYGHPVWSDTAGGLWVSSDFAYVLLDDLRVLDVSDPTRPTLCGFYPAGRATFASDLFASGNLVYLVDTLGLRIFQFTGDDSGAPRWRLYR